MGLRRKMVPTTKTPNLLIGESIFLLSQWISLILILSLSLLCGFIFWIVAVWSSWVNLFSELDETTPLEALTWLHFVELHYIIVMPLDKVFRQNHCRWKGWEIVWTPWARSQSVRSHFLFQRGSPLEPLFVSIRAASQEEEFSFVISTLESRLRWCLPIPHFRLHPPSTSDSPEDRQSE